MSIEKRIAAEIVRIMDTIDVGIPTKLDLLREARETQEYKHMSRRIADAFRSGKDEFELYLRDCGDNKVVFKGYEIGQHQYDCGHDDNISESVDGTYVVVLVSF